MFHLARRNIGADTAAPTMPVAKGFISCGTVGTTTNTFRATRNFTVTAGTTDEMSAGASTGASTGVSTVAMVTRGNPTNTTVAAVARGVINERWAQGRCRYLPWRRASA